MDLDIYQIDAFADEVFKGNPAAIIPLQSWISEQALQSIAMENNLAETAYFVPHENAKAGHYHLRWFTPEAEVDLCGHATLASAYVLFEFLGEKSEKLTFYTHSGELVVERNDDGGISMDFPALSLEEFTADPALVDAFSKSLGQPIEKAYTSLEYLFCVLSTEEQVRNIVLSGLIEDTLRNTPYWGLIVTAQANEDSAFDCVSRFFAPEKGVPEDPVTGSAHCRIAPYWGTRLGKTDIVAYQASPRGGTLHCHMEGARVILSGRAAPFLKGTISIPDIG